MQRTLNWSSEISEIAGPIQARDTRESWLARAARKSGATVRQIKALYYGEIIDPKFSLATQVLAAANKARLEAARRDAKKLAEIYQNAAGALSEIDQDFHGENIDALVNAARILSSLDGTGT